MVFKINKTEDYSIISNKFLREKDMSLKAKGLLAMMLSLPDSWVYSINGLVAICKEEESAIKTTLQELKRFGYLSIDKCMPNTTQSGRIEYVYNIYEEPHQKQEGDFLPLEILTLENQGQYNTNKEEYEDKENIKRNEEPNLTSLLTAPNETPIEQQEVKKGTETIIISALNDIYTKIEFMYKKCGYKDKLAKKDTITRLKTICNNTNKSKRLHPLQILLSYGAYLAECRKYGKDVQYVKQSNFFLTSMVYDYAEKTASDFEQRVVEKYGDGWKKYKVVD
jgi:hypothetical protein|nr:MAG TPA: Dna polymerase B [Bacteriophage sp.]